MTALKWSDNMVLEGIMQDVEEVVQLRSEEKSGVTARTPMSEATSVFVVGETCQGCNSPRSYVKIAVIARPKDGSLTKVVGYVDPGVDCKRKAEAKAREKYPANGWNITFEAAQLHAPKQQSRWIAGRA